MGKVVSSDEAITAVNKDGWIEVRVTGSHHHFRHPTKLGTVTIPHPYKNLKKGTVSSIERQAGIKIK